jgi:mycothiol synthase
MTSAEQTRQVDIDVDLQWRPFGRADLAAWASLISVVQAFDRDEEILGEAELAEEFDAPLLDFARGSLAVFDGDTVVAMALLEPRSEANPVHLMHVWARVHPKYRGLGIGTRLVEWAEQAAVPLHKERFGAAPLALLPANLARVTDAVTLLEANGYRQTRWFHAMACDMTVAPAEATVPDGVQIVGYTTERLEDALLVRNESFRDHWGSSDISDEEWAYFMGFKMFRPAFSFLAYIGAEPAGVLIAHEYDTYNQLMDTRDVYIATVGVRQFARNRGIASALLATAMRTAWQDGCVAASLGVDADSLTGAVGVYERLGFTIKDTSITLMKELLTG